MEKIMPLRFQAEMYGELSPTLNYNGSRTGRARIFYKGLNRNNSIITEENANDFIKTAPGKPVVGEYDEVNQDFLQHSSAKRAKAYGFISQSPNFKWEEWDGKEYACMDVELWPDYWVEASLIPQRPLSMELDEVRTKGQWVESEDYHQLVFHYSQLAAKGICVLGAEVTPCFENAEFYSFAYEMPTPDNLTYSLVESMLEYGTKIKQGGEKEKMDNNVTYLWQKPDFLPQDFTTDNSIYFNFDNKAKTVTSANWNDGNLTRFSEYQFDYADGTVTFTNPSPLFLGYQTNDDYNNLKTEKEILFSELETVKASLKEIGDELETQKALVAGFTEEKSVLDEKIIQLEEELATFKEQAERQLQKDKEDLVESFADKINAEELEAIKKSMKDFTLEQLEAKLSVSFARNFTKQGAVIPTGNEGSLSSITKLLMGYTIK